MTANVGIAERADRLVAVLAGHRPGRPGRPRGRAGRGARPARRREPRHRRASGCSTVRRQALSRRVRCTRRWRDALAVGGYRARVGAAVAATAGAGGIRALRPARRRRTVARGGKGVQRLRANYARVRPELGDRRARRPGPRRDALLPALLLRGVPPARPHRRATSPRRVRVEGDGPVRAELAAGAARRRASSATWATGTSPAPGAPRTSGPVTTVAERLKPEEVFDEFLAFRESLGHDDHPAHRWRRRLPRSCAGAPAAPVHHPLLADRDLTAAASRSTSAASRRGWPPGPAALALATGAALHPVSIHYERRDGSGWRQRHRHHLPHRRSPAPDEGTTREQGATAMTQACADVLGAAIARAHRGLAHAAAGLRRRPRPRRRAPGAAP